MVTASPATARAAGWSVVQMWGGRAIVLLVFLWIARLVEPEAIGLFVFAQAIVVASRLLTLRGLATAVVRRPQIDPLHLDVVLWTQLMIAIPVSAALILLGGPLVARAGRPDLAAPLAALAPLLVVWALTSVQAARLRRELSFRTLALRTIGAHVVGGCAGVMLAYRGAGVWSLVAMTLTGEIAGAILLWSASGWSPRFRYSRARLMELAPFGIRASASEALDFVVEQGDDLLVGAVLGPVALGFYATAYRLVRFLRAVVVEPVDHFVLPAFARIQARTDRLSARFADVTGGLAVVAFPLFAALAALAPGLVRLALGPGWEGAVPVVRVLAAAAALRVAVAPARSALLATGRAGACLRLDLAAAALSAAGFVVGLRWGIVGVAVAHVVARSVMLPAFVVVAARALGVRAGRVWRGLAVAAVGAAAVLAAAAATSAAPAAVHAAATAGTLVALYALVSIRLAALSRRAG